MPLTRNRPLAAALVLVAAAALCSSAGVVRPGRVASPSVLQGPRNAPAVVTSGSGERITCPEGAEPGVNLTAATFTPPLRGGTMFRRATYDLVLTGVVVNETTRSIVVTRVDTFAGQRPWRARVQAPVSLAANSSGRLVLRGRYTSRAARPASVAARLHWRWQDPGLAPCGALGLIEGD
ncbi:MAG TPA: hypothetical protein VGP02_01735 [Mycobacteriales bacterium]|jgi:hypothetical protein|nr:hypothetical protein [Mycobacteriales bacterium]